MTKCSHKGCPKEALFNFTGLKPAFCGSHKSVNMVDVRNNKCSFGGCMKQPHFNIAGSKKGIFCSEHKAPDMVNVVQKKCSFGGCTKRPSFNIAGSKKGIFCSEHKAPDMVDVVQKKCSSDGCIKKPFFNVAGSKVGLFCGDHKTVGMVNVVNKTCAFDGCTKQPRFNLSGSKVGKFCAEHKLDLMVNVVDKKCSFDGCTKIPNFNVLGSKVGLFCDEHKAVGMVNVVTKKCSFDGCTTICTGGYGHPGFQPTRCAQHREAGMLLKSNARCSAMVVSTVGSSAAKKCGEPATHGVRFPERCEVCSIEGDMNLVEKMCDSCNLVVRINPKTGFCDTCSPGVASMVRLAKQREVVQFLSVNSPHKPDSIDKIPEELKACRHRERPDILFRTPDRVVIIEVDEYKHEGNTCDTVRMYNVAQDLGYERCIWLRYNPDDFKRRREDSKRWTNNARLTLLGKWLDRCCTAPLEDFPTNVSVVHLFYDRFCEGDVKVQSVEYDSASQTAVVV